MTDTFSEGFNCLIYPGANARPKITEITNIYDEDARYFHSIGAKISMEPVGSQYALYADIGMTEDDRETPREVVVLSGDDSCQDSFKRLRAACEQAKKEMTNEP